MARSPFRLTVLATLFASVALPSAANSNPINSFNRVASFAVANNMPLNQDAKQTTSAEIITATPDGNTLIYSDSPLGGIGFVDIKDPAAPQAAGFLSLNGEPTSVSAFGQWVVAGVNTSSSYTQPSGYLAVIASASRKIVAQCDLGGQPDSVAVSKDGRYIAVAIENERDEDLNDGAMPQMPAGFVVILSTDQQGKPDCNTLQRVELTGLAEIAGDDPEPEFVDFNDNHQIAVTLQENNHIVIIDAPTGKVVNHFSAGAVDLSQVDTQRDGALQFDSTIKAALREPDAVKWLDNERLVIANEGDYQGGARGFTIFNKNGTVLFESGAELEHHAIRVGHYPEKRSNKKGIEPEGLEVATFNGQQYIFVLAERASLVGVYKDTGGKPEFVQVLPSGIAPESAIAIPKRQLLATANEADLGKDGGARSHIMIYQLSDKPAHYPQIVSANDAQGVPIGWGALSGLASDAQQAGKLYAVNDSFYAAQPSIFTIDATKQPAVIERAITVKRDGKVAKHLDLEGITSDGNGGFWLASEGNLDKKVPHALYRVDANGEITQTVAFPAQLLAEQTRFGAEGITLVGDTLWVAIQRPWQNDDKALTKLLAYNTKTEQWSAVHYPLEKTAQGWVGLSEITYFNDALYLVERDNQVAEQAKIKRLYKVALADVKPAPLGSKLPIVTKQLAYDFLPDLKAGNGYVLDKIEGFAIDASGQGYAVTDNDGVDDSSGETMFFKVNPVF
ncbi:esterase-like activity of phytase family protein [Vibrio misgurnus]|uniref:esterase-like activity of phytase family protein n=1 Tax=Vibrio misgurnus TaxID=2993714 RepID=UPI0023F8EAF2|nr:esterase-like activity of phytase family protein [Vibrio sp. VCS]